MKEEYPNPRACYRFGIFQGGDYCKHCKFNSVCDVQQNKYRRDGIIIAFLISLGLWGIIFYLIFG